METVSARTPCRFGTGYIPIIQHISAGGLWGRREGTIGGPRNPAGPQARTMVGVKHAGLRSVHRDVESPLRWPGKVAVRSSLVPNRIRRPTTSVRVRSGSGVARQRGARAQRGWGSSHLSVFLPAGAGFRRWFAASGSRA